MLPENIYALDIFWDLYVNQEIRKEIDPTEYATDMEGPRISGWGKGKVVAQDFNYKIWVWKTTNYLEVKITDEMHLATKTTLPTFRWCYCVMGKDLDLYNNANLSWTPKAKNYIIICTGYFDYSLRILFSPFVTMDLNHFKRSPDQCTAHFHLILSILEDINNTVSFEPLSMENLLAYYYVKFLGERYMLYKGAHKKMFVFSQ